MTTNMVAIAKASLIAPFVRPDPTTVSRDELNVFHEHLEAALRQCSPTNIQQCRSWLSSHATTVTRISAIGKYLSALSSSLTDELDLSQLGKARTKSAARKRLHILYLLNDWFHFAARHHVEDGVSSDVLDMFQKFVPELFHLIGSCNKATHPKLHLRMRALLTLWREQKYFNPDFVNRLQEVLDQNNQVDQGNIVQRKTLPAEPDETAPFIMPTQHGHPETPWYDLPAANMIPHITPNLSRPVDPQSLIPVRLPAALADSLVVAAVQDFLLEMEDIYRDEEVRGKLGVLNYDALGQKVYRNKEGDDVSYGGTYYGWSKGFCERMKIRLNETTADESRSRERRTMDLRGYSLSSGSRSRSRSGRRSATRSRSRSRSESRSRSRAGHRNYHRLGRSGSSRRRLRRSVSRSESRSLSATSRGREQLQTLSRNERERSYSPPAVLTSPMEAGKFLIPPPPTLQGSFALPSNFSGISPSGTSRIDNLLQIPPRPPGWQGPWPPPPPPPPQQMHDHTSIAPLLPIIGQGEPQPASHFHSEGPEYTQQARYSGWHFSSAPRH